MAGSIALGEGKLSRGGGKRAVEKGKGKGTAPRARALAGGGEGLGKAEGGSAEKGHFSRVGPSQWQQN